MDLDRHQIGRLQSLSNLKKIGAKQVFESERVIQDLPKEKVLIEGFGAQNLLSIIPFYERVYCTVCPSCASRANLDPLFKLSRAGLVVPVLLSFYKHYDQTFTKEIRGIDHISAQEFEFFSNLRLGKGEVVCQTCAWEQISKTLEVLKRRPGVRYARETMKEIFKSSYPYLKRDEYVFYLAEQAIKDGNLHYLEPLRNLSWTLKSLRSAETLNAAVLLDPDELLPEEEILSNEEQIRQLRIALRSELIDGLAINVPIDLPIDTYIEMIREVQPQINNLVQEEIAGPCRGKSEQAITRIRRRVMEINRQIERLECSTSYAAVNALGKVIKDNPLMFAGILSAAAAGLAGSLAGCAVAGGYTVRKVAQLAKKYSQSPESPEVGRFGRLLRRDLQPGLDKLIAKYMGVESAAVRVLNIRKRLEQKRAA